MKRVNKLTFLFVLSYSKLCLIHLAAGGHNYSQQARKWRPKKDQQCSLVFKLAL